MISLTCVNCLNHLQLWVVVSLVSSLILFMPHTIVEVTVVEMADRIIPAMDKEVSLELQKSLLKGYEDRDILLGVSGDCRS